MKVEAVERKHNTCLYPMAQGALVGSVVGFATKYAYPLNAEEKNTPAYRSVMEEISSQKNKFGAETKSYLDDINKKTFKSLAEDTFVKMFDGVKEGEKVPFSQKKKALKTIQESNPAFVDEFKALCRQAQNIAEKNANKCISAYNFVTKHMRPTGVFVVGGAIVGAIIALINDVLRTDVKRS